jgi:hypothetical protein
LSLASGAPVGFVMAILLIKICKISVSGHGQMVVVIVGVVVLLIETCIEIVISCVQKEETHARPSY